MATCFSARYHATLRELFAFLGVSFTEDDPDANARAASAAWMGEHRSTNVDYPKQQLLRVYDDFGSRLQLVGEIVPAVIQPGCRIHNPGGTLRAMVKRFRLYQSLVESGAQPGTFLCWAGQRLRDLRLGETVPELLAFVRRERPAVLHDSWFQAELAKDDMHPDRYMRPFATETEIMILVAKVVCGCRLQLMCARSVAEPARMLAGPQGKVRVPGRTVLYYKFKLPDDRRILILNGGAVERRAGDSAPLEPRPTVRSTAREVAEIWGFGNEGLMVSNPHSERLAQEIGYVARVLGFSVDFAVYCLPAPAPVDDEAKLRMAKTILGEVARILTNERRFGAEAGLA